MVGDLTGVGIEWTEETAGTTIADGQHSEYLQVDVKGGPIEIGSESSISIRVRNADTGKAVTLPPAADGDTYAVTELYIDPVPLARGNAPRIGVVGPNTTGFHNTLTATPTGDTDVVQAGSFASYAVELIGPEGTVVASTEPAVHGVDVNLTVTGYNGTALAVETTPAIPAGSHVVVTQTVDRNTESVAVLRPTATDGRLVASVGDTAFDADESFNVDIYGAEGEPLGARHLGVFGLSVGDNDRVDGPLEDPSDGTDDEGDEDGDDPGTVPAVVGDAPPTDGDGDGVCEDVDGNGQFTILDVVAFLEAYDTATVESNTAAFDVDGNGQVTILDVVALLDQV
jgi:PKD repeat protein